MSWFFRSRRREFTKLDAYILGAVLIVMFIMHLFSQQEYIHCLKGVGCRVYQQETTFSPKKMTHKFQPEDIVSYKTKEQYHSGKHTSHYTYRPILMLKDGTEIEFETFNWRHRSATDKFIEDIKTKSNYKKSSPSLLYKLFNE
ncbi:hypothetical protein IJ541_10465 [bacterium]|nr:hypothetical protein [bacterium]